MKTLLIVVLGFVGGFAGRGIFETPDAPWWGSILVYAPLFIGTLLVSRRLDKETKRVSARPPMGPFGMPIVTSQAVPDGQVIIMNPAMRDLVMRGADINPRHLEDCPRRTDYTSICTCGTDPR